MRRARWIGGVVVAAAIALAWLNARAHESAAVADPQRATTTAATTTAAAPGVAARSAPALPAIDGGALRLEGLALDEGDRPVAGARITLDGQRTVTTELDGSFAFDGLAAGSYEVVGEKDFAYAEARAASLDDTSDPVTLKLVAGPTVVFHVVEPSGEPIVGAKLDVPGRTTTTDEHGAARLRGVDYESTYVSVSADGHASALERIITGDDASATIEHTIVLGPGYLVSGRVVDEGGKPVAAAMVELESSDGTRDDIVHADDSGAWQVEHVAGGTYKARASSEVHTSSEDVTFAVSGDAQLVLHVEMGGQIAGRVTDERGQPVAGARVSAGTQRATSDDTGAFVVGGLKPDSYDVYAETDEGGSTSHKIEMAHAGRVRLDLTVVPTTISGTVVDTRGQPIEGARVRTSGPDPNGNTSTRTDTHGHFALTGIPPGAYEVSARRSDETKRLDVMPIQVMSGAHDVLIVLPELGAVVGRVVLAGTPVRYYGIAFASGERSLELEHPQPVHDPLGTFRQRGFAAGTWSMVVVGPGFARREITGIHIAPGDVVDLGDIEVERGAVLHGRVLDASGAPVAGASVKASKGWSERPGESLRSLLRGNYAATTDAGGNYEIAGLADDSTMSISATHPVLGVAYPRAVTPGQTAVDLQLAFTGTIDGTVANYRPELSTTVTATLVSAPDSHYDADVDATGAFHFVVPPGDYEVTGFGLAGPSATTVVAGQPSRVTLAATADRP